MSPLTLHSFILTSLVTLAAGGELLRRQDSQAFDIIPTFGFGEDCTDSFGETFEWCGPEEARYCYDPAAGEVCCFDTTDPWSCPVDSFCLVEDVCCPEGLDPATCATENSVSLPADFSIDNNNGDDGVIGIIPDDVEEVIDVDEGDGVIEIIPDNVEEDIDVDEEDGFTDIIPDNVEEGIDVDGDDAVIGIIPADSEATAEPADETFTDIADIEPSVTPSSKDDAVVFEGAANANAVALSTPGLVFGLFCFARILL